MTVASAFLVFSATVQAQSTNSERIHEAIGKDVRMTHIDGSRTTGTLVAFSTGDVVLRRNDRERRVELVNVDRVERVRHRTRNAALWAVSASGVGIGFSIIW